MCFFTTLRKYIERWQLERLEQEYPKSAAEPFFPAEKLKGAGEKNA